jgi:hypothetical protein
MIRTSVADALSLISIRANGMTDPVAEFSVGRPDTRVAAHPLLAPIMETNIAPLLIAERRVILGVSAAIRRSRTRKGQTHASLVLKHCPVNVANALF